MGALDRFRLDGRVALITGAGRGIGAGCARVYAEAGADVAITARTEEQLDAVAAEVRAFGRRAVVVPGDVTDLAFLAEFVDTAVRELGRVDTVVNNAGGGGIGSLLSVSAGGAGRGAALAFAYCLGLGLPFVLVAAGLGGRRLVGWARQHRLAIGRFGGVMLVAVGVLLVSGVWTRWIDLVRVWLEGGGFRTVI